MLFVLGALLWIAQIGFLALVLWAAAVPNAEVVSQLKTAYANRQLTTANVTTSPLGNYVGTFSECASLSLDLYNPGYRGRLRSVLADDVVAGCGPLPDLLAGHSIPWGSKGWYSEFRYWNGYRVLLRPFVAWFGLPATRAVVTALLIGSLLFFAATMGKVAGWLCSAALVGPLLLTTDFPDLPQSLNYGISMSALLVGAAAVAAVVLMRGARPVWVAGAALLSGAVYCYLDILLYPPLALGLTVAAAALSSYRILPADRRSLQLALFSVVASAAWVAGWAFTWATKWLISAVLFGPSFVFRDVGGEIMLRLDGTENTALGATGTLDESVGTATKINLVDWLYGNPIRVDVILACTGLAIAFMVVAVARHRVAALREMGLLLAPGLLPFLWYETLRNHSIIHASWTSSSLAFTLGLAIAAPACVALRGHVSGRTIARPD
ncbi:MAG: hypothetical protein J2P57_13825 [Acidimicrobiaceae bacterium]|nr:hypothetical protein [Acidimicrobiaceae bacterium]